MSQKMIISNSGHRSNWAVKKGEANYHPLLGHAYFSDEIFSDHPELWELRSDDPHTLLEGFENGIKIAGENGDFIGIPNKGNDLYYLTSILVSLRSICALNA